MNDRPLESWFRDMLYEDPWHLVSKFRSREDKSELLRYKEFATDAGPADLFFVWQKRALVVELKRDLADESAVAQVLRYAFAIECEIGVTPHRAVIAPRFTRNALYAAQTSDTACFTIGFTLNRIWTADRIETPDGRRLRNQQIFEAYVPKLERHVFPDGTIAGAFIQNNNEVQTS